MRHALHEFLWLLRRRRTLLTLHALAWFALTWISWAYSEETGSRQGFLALHLFLLTMTGLLALDAGEAAPAAGTRTFWRTRPPRWRMVWLAQLLYVLLALMGPALLCWMVNGLLLDQTAAQWRAGLMAPAVMLAALLVLTVLRSLADGWEGGLVVLFVAGGLIAAGASLQWMLEEHIEELRRSPMVIAGKYHSTTDLAWFFVIAFLVPAAGMTAVWRAGMRRQLAKWSLVAGGVWLVCAPPLIWLALRDARTAKLTLVANGPGETARAGERILGLLKVQGLPEDREMIDIVDYPDVDFADPPDPAWPEILHVYPIGWTHAPVPWLTPRAGERVRAHFPAPTRWYADAAGEARLGDFALYECEWHQPLRAKLSGALIGRLAAPARGFSLPLTAGASAARDGTHLHITAVQPGLANLRLRLEVRHAFSEFYQMHDRARLVLVLHLPALPAALLISDNNAGDFHSLQCSGDHLRLDVTMPDAEYAVSARWTPEVLRGAELWHFAPAEETPFVAVPEEGIVRLYPAEAR